MTALVAARVALVICAFIFLIAFQRRKRLFTVKTADDAHLRTSLDAFVVEQLTENRLILVLSGFFGAMSLAYVIYTLIAPASI